MENNTLGQKLLNALKMNGMTQAELAEKMNTTEVTVSRWVNGIRNPKADALKKMCLILNVSTDWMLDIPTSKAPDELAKKLKEQISTVVDNEIEEILFCILGRTTLRDPSENSSDYAYCSGYNRAKAEDQEIIKEYIRRKREENK